MTKWVSGKAGRMGRKRKGHDTLGQQRTVGSKGRKRKVDKLGQQRTVGSKGRKRKVDKLGQQRSWQNGRKEERS